jgi:hypothetical protein
VRPTSLPRCRRSIKSTSCLFRRGCMGTAFRGWSGDVCPNEADRDRGCRSGRRLIGTTRRTRLRIADHSISLSNGSSNFSMRSSGDRRPLYTGNTHCSATTTRLIAQGPYSLRDARGCSSAHLQPFRSSHNRQTNGLDNRIDANFRHAPVISRHAATHVVLGDDADQHEGIRAHIVQ